MPDHQGHVDRALQGAARRVDHASAGKRRLAGGMARMHPMARRLQLLHGSASRATSVLEHENIHCSGHALIIGERVGHGQGPSAVAARTKVPSVGAQGVDQRAH